MPTYKTANRHPGRKQAFILGFICLTACFLASFAWTTLAGASEPSLNVKSAMLMDLTSGRILYEQDADRAIAPASTTKIMTMYLVYEALQNKEVTLDQPVVISRRADAAGGTRMPVRPGETPTLNEVMRGMAVVSGNNACVAAAEHLEGDVKSFVQLMNDTARSLGMTHTTFKNPNGLPARGQVTTARDMLTLGSRYLKRYPEALRFHSQKYYYYNNFQGHNANTLLGECEGVDGLKTGFVASSGFNIIATAKRGSHRLVAAVMGAESSRTRGRETEKLLELGFATLDGDQARVAQVRETMNTDRPVSLAAKGHRKKHSKHKDPQVASVERKHKTAQSPSQAQALAPEDGPRHTKKSKARAARLAKREALLAKNEALLAKNEAQQAKNETRLTKDQTSASLDTAKGKSRHKDKAYTLVSDKQAKKPGDKISRKSSHKKKRHPSQDASRLALVTPES